ncbi:MAG: T9SS type A sorting domain-containing protein [Gracilimonas sp.]|nr:T9SS type A sorting domain-containing protein [Gracilimonas sp.]
MKTTILTTILTFVLLTISNIGFAQSGTEIFTETFDAATSIDGWNTAADAASRPGDVTLEWAETAGVSSTGAMRFGGVNSDPAAGRAYIVEKIFSAVNFGGVTDVTVSVSIQSEGLTSSNLAILTEISGSIQEIASATGDINETGYTTLTFNHPAIPTDANFVKLSFNIAAGAVQDAGGTILIDDIKVTPNDNSGGAGEELITNGDFENGRASWTDTAGEIRTEGDNSYFFADVASAGNAYDVNLSQILEIVQGENYILTFDASTSTGNNRTMIAGIGLNEGSFAAATETVNLTDQMQTFTLQLTATGFGSTNSRVLFDMGAETGIVVIDNVSLVQGGDGTPPEEVAEPTAAAPTPPNRDAGDVISIYSDAYTNTGVSTYIADFSQGSLVNDVEIVSGDFIKLYDIGNFIAIRLDNGTNLTDFTHMHFDYWIADASVGAGAVINPKLSNHADLPTTPGETNAIGYTNPVTTAGQWVSFDVPLDDFTSESANGLLDRENIYEIVLTTAGTVNMVYFDNIYFYKDVATSIDGTEELPNNFTLDQNYPNPFNPTTNISYTLPANAEVTLEVFNVAGQRVATLVDAFQSTGSYDVTFDASNLASGLYTYRLTTGNSVQVKKMMLIK